MSYFWHWLAQDKLPASLNMAIDEALLELAPIGRAVFRTYGWSEPAATFGYAQHYADVAKWTSLRPLIRRPTGGGLVPHDADWTYSVVIHPFHPWYQATAVQSYLQMHEWIVAAFKSLGVAVELARAARKETPGQCFIGAEKFDVLFAGRKIAGAAQRRTRSGLLIQGSVQPPSPDLKREDWEASMREKGVIHQTANWEPLEFSGELKALADRLDAAKYSRREHNEKR